MLQEHIPDQALLEEIFSRHIENPKEFWTLYPLPSIAADDPRFVGDYPDNSWGGEGQAHTAMRVPLWMEYYGKFAHERVLMEKWVGAIIRADDFRQQMNPFSGELNTTHSYSPAMCVLIDFVSRQYDVKLDEDGTLLWGCTKAPGATLSTCCSVIKGLNYLIVNENNQARLYADSQLKLTVYGDARIRTDLNGCVLNVYKTGFGKVITEQGERSDVY